MTHQVTDITINGCLFAKREIDDPIKYIQGVFKQPEKINVLKHSGRLILFRVAGHYDNDSYDFTDLITNLTYDPPTNITYEINFSTRAIDNPFDSFTLQSIAS